MIAKGYTPLWLGPETYSESQSSRFYGRDIETLELVELLRRETVVLLHGESGHGKSSLIQAGVMPVLRAEGALPILMRDLFRDDDGDLVGSFFKRIEEAARNAPVPINAPTRLGDETIWEYFHRQDSHFTTEDHQPLMPVLILDQFEDLFRRCSWRDGQTGTSVSTLVRQLSELIENRVPAAVRRRKLGETAASLTYEHVPLRVLIAIREDALPELTQLRDLVPSLSRAPYRLSPLRSEAARKVIVTPVQRSPDQQQLLGEHPDSIADDILQRLGGGVFASSNAKVFTDPFILSVVLDQLQRLATTDALPDSQPVITHSLIGERLNVALDYFYEGAIESVPARFRHWLEETAGLVSAGGYRNSLATDDAESRFPEALKYLRALETAHLLRSEEKADGSRRFELSHDRLCEVMLKRTKVRSAQKAARERWILFGLASVFAVLAMIAAYFAISARRAEEHAIQETAKARKAEDQALQETSKARDAENRASIAKVDALKAKRDADTANAVAQSKAAQAKQALDARDKAEDNASSKGKLAADFAYQGGFVRSIRDSERMDWHRWRLR